MAITKHNWRKVPSERKISNYFSKDVNAYSMLDDGEKFIALKGINFAYKTIMVCVYIRIVVAIFCSVITENSRNFSILRLCGVMLIGNIACVFTIRKASV